MHQQPQTSSPPTNTMAVISLVSGILSWFIFPVVGALVAVITGHMARNEIRSCSKTTSKLCSQITSTKYEVIYEQSLRIASVAKGVMD